jgi:carbonic anhydrase
VDCQEAADALAQRRQSGVPAGPPPILGRMSAPVLAGDELADQIARRVMERMSRTGASGNSH